jgi:hypothetical protein
MIWEVEVRKVADVEIRVEAKTAAEAMDKAVAIAQDMEVSEWWEEEIQAVQAGRAYDHQENEIRYDGDFLVCECGNDVHKEGFATTDTGGVEVQPEVGKWDGKTYRCHQCGSNKSVEKESVK